MCRRAARFSPILRSRRTWPSPTGTRRDPAEVYADFPALEAKRFASGGSLSGGQQQQLAIARVLLAAPRLMLLDEPSDGFQPSVVEEIGETLLRVKQRTGMGLVLVEQGPIWC